MDRAEELIETIDAAAAELAALDLSGLALGRLGPLLRQVERSRALVDAAAIGVLDRFDAEGAAAYDGLRTTRAWLAQHCQSTAATASRRVRTARALRELPEVAEGFRTGRFSADQADLFARNRNERTADAMATDEKALAALADHLRPDEFARELRGWAEMVDTDGAEPDPGHRDRGFTFVQTLHGRWTGRVDLSSGDGAFLRRAVEEVAEQLWRSQEAGARDDTAAAGGPDGEGPMRDSAPSAERADTTHGARRTAAQRRADALLELVRRGLGREVQAAMPSTPWSPGPTGPEPDSATAGGRTESTDVAGSGDTVVPTSATGPDRRPARSAVVLHLLLDAADLEAGRGADTLHGDDLSAAATGRLTCDSALLGVLRDRSSGAVLNWGRSRRTVSASQRAALAVRDGGCSFPGCDAPPQDCDAHHIVHWRDGGPTDLSNLTLCCWGLHHKLVHEGAWSVAADPAGGRPTWHRPDGQAVSPAPGWDSRRAEAGLGPPRPAAGPERRVGPGRPREPSRGRTAAIADRGAADDDAGTSDTDHDSEEATEAVAEVTALARRRAWLLCSDAAA